MSMLKKIATTLGALVVTLGAVTMGAPTASADAPAVGRIFEIHRTYADGEHPDLCLGIQGGSVNYGAPVIQWNCNNNSDQRWYQRWESGRLELVNVNSGLCLDIPGGSRNAGVGLVQWQCNGGANQKWFTRNARYGSVLMSNYNQLVADMPGGTDALGTQLIQWYPGGDGSDNQQWFLLPV
ncbi:RICIN domain-containing protein [Embleya sp. AB8]|uniref:RICIN domain-containing protein n=1 Tax=Embleya sp. AB8 TaxID=3156304 RepID=UPI003C77F2FF